MHTIIVIAGGLALLGIFLLTGRWLGGAEHAALVAAAKIFIPVWLVASVINLWMGVSRAGYTVAEEAPVLLVVFAVPAAIAAFVWWRYS
jgi:hypothetical protein